MDDDFDGREVLVGQESKPTTASTTTGNKQQSKPKKVEAMTKEAAKKAFEARLAKKKEQNGGVVPQKKESKKEDKKEDKKEEKPEEQTDAKSTAEEEVSKRKRKREADKARKKLKTEGGEAEPTDSKKEEKKPTPKKPSVPGKQPTTPEQKARKQKEKREPLQEDPVNENIAQMNPTLISDYIAQQIRKFDKDLSSVELEERYVPSRYIYDAEKLPKERSLKALPAFLKALYAETQQPKNNKNPGHPHTIVITAAAIRAVEFRRGILPAVPEKQHSTLTKLFSKHIKLSDALANLTKYQSNYAIGTPKRIHDCMINDGPLKMDNLRWIIIDLSRLDAKGFNALEYPDILKDTVNILKEPKVREQLEKEHGQARIVIY